jgi:ribose 5-phosphate isomerase B
MKKQEQKPTIVIGSDHAGYSAKQAIIKDLAKQGYTLVDVGGFDPDASDDYPDYAREVAKAVATDKQKKTTGVLICGSGTGMAIAANKVNGVRAAVVYDKYSAQMARNDNDANVIALRGRGVQPSKNVQLVNDFLQTPFSGLARHKRRIKKLQELE